MPYLAQVFLAELYDLHKSVVLFENFLGDNGLDADRRKERICAEARDYAHRLRVRMHRVHHANIHLFGWIDLIGQNEMCYDIIRINLAGKEMLALFGVIE